MLDFANRPPNGPEDVSLSETGVYLLGSIHRTPVEWTEKGPVHPVSRVYGHVALAEIAASFEERPPFDEIEPILSRVHDLASELVHGVNLPEFSEGLGFGGLTASMRTGIQPYNVAKVFDEVALMRAHETHAVEGVGP